LFIGVYTQSFFINLLNNFAELFSSSVSPVAFRQQAQDFAVLMGIYLKTNACGSHDTKVRTNLK
jgi:hypothetical protein